MAYGDAVPTTGELIELDCCDSTNASLAALAAERAAVGDRLAGFTTLFTLDQRAGRGRLDRSWVAPAGTALAVSVLVVPIDPVGRPVGIDRLGWLPLAAGVAMTEAVSQLLPGGGAVLKWPNDVLVGERKVSGILAEVLPDGLGVIVGAGLNLTVSAEQLPVPSATSLLIEGADAAELPERALAAYLASFRSHVGALLTTGGSARASGLLERATQLCGSIGRQVAAELPDGARITGTATGLDDAGRLLIRTASGEHALAAGDVVHLRSAR